MAVPWLVVAPPLGAVCLRLALMVLVEFVLFVPGFFVNTRRALATEDIPMLQALTLWAAVIIVVISTLADLALVLIDPRIRAAGRPPG